LQLLFNIDTDLSKNSVKTTDAEFRKP